MERELILSFKDTRTISLGTLAEESERISVSSVIYPESYSAPGGNPSNTDCEITVTEDTTFSAAMRIVPDGKTAVLNFANALRPGGGVTAGAMAQEECLCRSSNLYEALISPRLNEDYYQYHWKNGGDLASDRIIYTPGVTVFKDDGDIPALLPWNQWFRVDVITCAAPCLVRIDLPRAELTTLFEKRIRNILESAKDNHAENLVLGAFGCGAFRNPPDLVAAAFRKVILEGGYRRCFKRIVFAIKRKNNSVCPNLTAFQEAFRDYMFWEDAGKTVEQFSPVFSLPSGRILQGEAYRAFQAWRKNNPFYGKKFSILGDSVSTLEGYNPAGYNVFFQGENCILSGVRTMSDTWWGMVIKYFGGELLVNNAWSGSRVTKLPGQEELFPSACSDERTGALHSSAAVPDVILVYIGTNDWAQHVKCGDFDPADLGIADEFRFDRAYEIMLGKLRVNYPDAEIFICTLNTTFMPGKPSFTFPHSFAGTHIEKFNDVIRTLSNRVYSGAGKGSIHLIDLYRYEIPYATIDGSHHTKQGMETFATMIIRSMADDLGGSFLDCLENTHRFQLTKEDPEGGRYVCRICAKRKERSSSEQD